jgi:hypothetical protein
MSYCVNNTLSICSKIINYCSAYCLDDLHCFCDCLSNKIINKRECVFNNVNIISMSIIIPTVIAVFCGLSICCRKKNNDDLPKYYEIIDVDDNTPLPLPSYQESIQPPEYRI